VLLGAKLAGACPLIGVDLFPHKLELARSIGATHVINSKETDFAAAVRDILGGKLADVVIDGTGNPAVLEKAFALTASHGKCVGFGVMPHDRQLSINTLPLHMGKTLTGSHGGSSRPDEDIPRYLRMMKHDLFHVKNFVSHRLPLEQVDDAIAKMRSGEVVHAMIHF